MKLAVIGSGSWGLAASKLLSDNGHRVTLWSLFDWECDMLREKRTNEKLLPGVMLPKSVAVTNDISFVRDCDMIVIAVPSYVFFETVQRLTPYVRDQIIVILSKGFDRENGYCLLSATCEEVLGQSVRMAALTGPSHAEEVARGIPTAVLAASGDRAVADAVQKTFSNDSFRVYTSPDIVGAELGGAMKNIIALAVGISDGAGLGDNTKAMLMTRGIAEMSRLGVLLGGRADTFSGLSGIGDIIVTCISQHSRNRRAGLLIGSGVPVKEAIERVGAVVEGAYATEAVHRLTRDIEVDLPICDAMYGLLYEDVPLAQVQQTLIARDIKPESDFDRHSGAWTCH